MRAQSTHRAEVAQEGIGKSARPSDALPFPPSKPLTDDQRARRLAELRAVLADTAPDFDRLRQRGEVGR
jgi:hypothetical protein